MKKWLKYLLLFWVLIFSTGIAMAQGPYEFTGSQTGQEWVNQNGTGGATAALNYTYITIPLNQGNSLEHLDYSISWKNHGWGGSSAASNAKINLYNNNTLITTLETIYENNSVNASTYHTYKGSLSFNNPISAGYNIKVEINAPNWGGNTWESYINSASITAVTGPLNEILIFEDDFETSPINPEWSTTTGVLPALFTYNSTQVFGEFGSKTINLDLSGLPTHTYIRVEFDLYIFDSWDGNNDNDVWKLKVDGVDRIHTDFDNIYGQSPPDNMQSYPHNVEFSNPVLTGAFQTGLPNLCHPGSPNLTSMYKINNITQHTGTSLTIGLQGLGLSSNLCDESWGIDNVKVYELGLSCNDDSFCDDFESGSFSTGNWTASSGSESSVVVGTSNSITGTYSAEFYGGAWDLFNDPAVGWNGGSYNSTSAQAWSSISHISAIDMCLDLATVSTGSVVMELDYNSSAWSNYHENSWFRVLVNGGVLADANGNLDHHLPGPLTLSYDLSAYIGTAPTITLQASCQWDDTWGDFVFVDNLCIIVADVLGCTDPAACNYDPLATLDDGSCIFPDGCTDPLACNYDALATCDDGSCILPDGCTDPTACNYDAANLCDDGSCNFLFGCTDASACNYDATAICDDNSCVYDVGIPIVTNSCSGFYDGMISVSVNPIDPSVLYTYTINAGTSTPYNDTIFSLSATNYDYEFFIDGISCGVETIIINEYAAMDLQTIVVDSTCDSNYAYVNVSLPQIAIDTIADVTPYCLSAPSILSVFPQIESVYLSGDNNVINNSTPLNTSVFYSDNTYYYADLSPGQTYSLDVQLNTVYGSSVNAGAKIYIDWNMNGDFTDTGEQIGMISNLPCPNDSSITINVPSNATPGATVMRIISQYNEDLGIETCSNTDYLYGETQDYTIVINSQISAVGLSYLWSPSGGTNDTTNSLVPDTYTVTVIDTNGCIATETAIITGLVFGCMDPTATNYDALAVCDDGSCTFTVLGCTDLLALNYDSFATIDDSSCIFLSDKVDLFFSEYAEGSSNNKYFEVYNPTGDTVDLSNYAYPLLNNDTTNYGPGIYEYWNDFDLGAVILPNDVFVVTHTSANGLIQAQADMIVSGFTALSNGNDGMALIYGIEPSSPTTPNNGSYVILDWVGDWDGGPTNGWDVAGINNATKDHTLVRKCPIFEGNPNSFISLTGSAGIDSLSSEWIVFEEDDWTNIGEHSFPCPILGCTDSLACNYDSTATSDDGSCIIVILDSLVAVPSIACIGDIVNLTAYPSNPLYEYRFMYNIGAGWPGNSLGPWSVNNPITYNNITQQTEFRVKIRSSIDTSCKTGWETIIVPVNLLPTSTPIWHN